MAENNSSAPLKTAEGAAQPSNLPSWEECQLRVSNSEFIAKRIAEGGYGAEHDSKLATELHRFIHEYDDADSDRSAWFRHRLEKLLHEVAAQAVAAQAAPSSEQHGWQPIETAPKDQLVMVYTPPTIHDYPDSVNIRFDHIDSDIADDYWYEHGEHYEHYCCVAKPEGSIGPSAEAPYTHWQAIPAAPSLAVKKAAPAPLATAPFPMPPKAITASLMLDDGGERPVYCLMAAYPSEADARAALTALAATPALPATEDSSAGDLADWLTPVSELLGHISDALPDDEFAKIDTAKWNAVSSLVGTNRWTSDQAEVQAEPVADEQIKAAFLANGFTIKEGLTDLKPYVYQAARALLKLAAPQAQPADALDADGEAFRTAAKLGLTLRFYGGCAQSSKPRTPSAYAEVAGPDPAASMREAVQKVKTTIDAAMAAAQEGGNASAGKDGAA